MRKLKTLYFEDFVDFACEASDMYDSIKDDFKAVAIVAKYEEAKEILKELICIGYDIAHIELCDCKLCLNGMPVPLLRNCYSIFNGTKYR